MSALDQSAYEAEGQKLAVRIAKCAQSVSEAESAIEFVENELRKLDSLPMNASQSLNERQVARSNLRRQQAELKGRLSKRKAHLAELHQVRDARRELGPVMVSDFTKLAIATFGKK